MTELKIRKIGNSLGVILPKEALGKLRVSEGDVIYLSETLSGVALSTSDADFAKQMEAAEKVMRKRRNVLRELAK
jgi:putative addiction module antidote